MPYTIDGALDEWSRADRIDYPGTGSPGFELYGRIEGDALVFAVQYDTAAIGPGTTFWLNTDRNAATGYQIFGTTGGAEHNVNFHTDNAPYLYTGAAAEALVSVTPLQYAYGADNHTVEFAVPLTQIGETDGVLDVLADINNALFLPTDYGSYTYTVVDSGILPQPTETGLKVAIVYSETSASAFFDKTAYSQLFMSAQNQCAMAGVPFDILTEADLTDVGKLAQYDTLIFPSFQNVPAAKVGAITKALTDAVYDYGVGLIAAGNFMTSDETGAALPGDSYARMKTLLGVDILGGGWPLDVTVAAGDTSHPAMEGYAAGEVIRAYSGVGTQYFGSLVADSSVLATQTVGGAVHNAVLATTTGGRNVHFATEGMLADNNMLHHALDWAVQDAGEPVLRLHMSRQAALFASRNDMDQSQEAEQVDPENGAPGIYDLLLPILTRWKAEYDFVGSYYINIGNDPAGGQTTNWAVSKPYYDALLAMGNEIGSHSWTHPDDTNLLTPEQRRFEFTQSKQVSSSSSASRCRARPSPACRRSSPSRRGCCSTTPTSPAATPWWGRATPAPSAT
jgi:serralysin